ncbi:MAG: HK97 gp10 family phage protein [Acetobacterium woodii]|nr:HK97 gp10 family phage protein [Acetobacterium woodii]
MVDMGRNIDYKQFEQFKKKLEKTLSEDSRQKFMEDCAKELAARLLSKVIKRTPVGKEDGGTLRRGWTGGVENTSEKGNVIGVGGKSGAASQINVVYRNGEYRCAIFNPVFYSSYVEYGHRTPSHDGWVDGQFFLTISENEVNALAPALLEKRLMEYLKGAFE